MRQESQGRTFTLPTDYVELHLSDGSSAEKEDMEILTQVYVPVLATAPAAPAGAGQ